MTHLWYNPLYFIFILPLLPLSWLFRGVVKLRRWLYRHDLFIVHRVTKPVIVVGNITVGGTGKTPLVIWLAQFLKQQGFTPGIVTRGVGGKASRQTHRVSPKDFPEKVGDEALLLCKYSGCEVMINVDRVAAAHALLENKQCDVILSDDGLQHYALGRDIEIALVDGTRRFGNHQLLPAGPLREPISRLKEVDFVLTNGGGEAAQRFDLEPIEFVSVTNPIHCETLDFFKGQKVHAIAGIGHPANFFHLLTQLGLIVIPHTFPDHHLYKATDLLFAGSYPLVMTEKDAVKCQSFMLKNAWCLRVHVTMNETFPHFLLQKLTSLEKLG